MNRTTRFALLALVPLAALASPAAAVSCGDSIAAGARVTLTAADPITSTVCATDPALTIHSGASVDLAGFTITCSTGSEDGILLLGEHVKLEDGAVRGCDYGVRVEGSGGHKLTNVVAVANDGGFLIADLSDGNKLKGCAATGSDSVGFLIDSSGNKLDECMASSNGNEGFVVTGDGNSLKKVVASSNQDDGLYFAPSGSGYGLKGSKSLFAANGGSGVATSGGEGLAMKGNRAAGNDQHGFSLEDTADSTLSGNVAIGNALLGFSVIGDGVKVSKNIANGNGTGLYADEADGLSLIGNRITANTYGISFDSVTNATVKSNTVLGSENNDIDDGSGCATNVYSRNVFGTSSDPCIE